MTPILHLRAVGYHAQDLDPELSVALQTQAIKNALKEGYSREFVIRTMRLGKDARAIGMRCGCDTCRKEGAK